MKRKSYFVVNGKEVSPGQYDDFWDKFIRGDVEFIETSEYRIEDGDTK